MFLILEGELEIIVDGKEMTVHQGQCAFARRGVSHQLRNVSGRSVRCPARMNRPSID